jgi:hypothetical protein
MQHVFIGREREIISFLWWMRTAMLYSVLLFRAMKTSPFWLGDLIVAEAKTETGWTLSRTKEHSDKLELVLNGLRSVGPILKTERAGKRRWESERT